MYLTEQTIKFNHKYKIGDTVWWYSSYLSDAFSSIVEFVYFSPSKGLIYELEDKLGLFKEEELFSSEKDAFTTVIDNLNQFNKKEKTQTVY